MLRNAVLLVPSGKKAMVIVIERMVYDVWATNRLLLGTENTKDNWQLKCTRLGNLSRIANLSGVNVTNTLPWSQLQREASVRQTLTSTRQVFRPVNCSTLLLDSWAIIVFMRPLDCLCCASSPFQTYQTGCLLVRDKLLLVTQEPHTAGKVGHFGLSAWAETASLRPTSGVSFAKL